MPARQKKPETAADVAAAILHLYRNDPTRWLQGEYAATSVKTKRTTHYRSSAARCWCLMGACYRVTDQPITDTYGETIKSIVISAFRDQIRKVTGEDVVDFNDSPRTKFRDVVSALRKISKPAT